MICPYCVKEVSPESTKHIGCEREPDKAFPLLYLDHHAGKNSRDPVVLSVIGFSGHGKTVFLSALFHYLDRYMSTLWSGFFRQALDQDSLTTLTINRESLEEGTLPKKTALVFPRPGIFRLRNMPHNGSPEEEFLDDTTVLIFDPPGEALGDKDQMVQFASFVERSDCVLFLVDLTTLKPPLASKMEKLLGTYVLGMRDLNIEAGSQHLIVVYTKSDDMKVSVPQFANWLHKQPDLERYLNDQMPDTLSDPVQHLEWLEDVSELLRDFTANELKARSFINMANEWFASVNYTAVSSLGMAPQVDKQTETTPGVESRGRLLVEMSPRGVVDPLLYVLSKSHKLKPYKQWWHWFKTLTGIATGAGVIILLTVTALFAAFYNADYRSGNDSMFNKDFRGAIQDFTKSIESHPKYAPAHTGRGLAFLELGETGEASSNCDRALELDPKDPEALVCRGRINTLQHSYTTALRDCNEAIELKPTLASAFQCRGFLHWYGGAHDKAIADYTKAIELDPQFARAYLNRWFANADNNNGEAARTDYDKAVELDGNRVGLFMRDHLMAYCNQGEVLARKGEFSKAIGKFDRALHFAPELITAYWGRAAAYKGAQKFGESEKDYTKVIALNQNYVPSYVARGEIRKMMGRTNDALEDYTQAINRNPDLFSAYLERAKVYMSQGEFKKAIADCQIIVARNPPEYVRLAHMQWGDTEFQEAKTKRIKGEREGCYSEASKHYRLAAALDTSDPLPLLKAAYADMGRNNWADAISEYEQAVQRDNNLREKRDPTISQAYFRAGDDCRAKFDGTDDSSIKDSYRKCATDNFSQAVRLDNKNQLAQRWLSYFRSEFPRN